MHDSITKIRKEYNGRYLLRGVDCETYKPSNLPCLTNEPGAMNSYLLKDAVTETIAKFSNVENSTHCHQQ